MAASIAFVGNTNDLLLTGLKSELEDTFLSSATVTATVNDSGGNPVVGENWPQPMVYVPGSNGNYVCGLSHLLQFQDGGKYTAVIDVDASDTTTERVAHWEFPFTAKVRTK